MPMEQIVRAIEEDRVLFVVGAGMSTAAGLPTSQQLSTKLNRTFGLNLRWPDSHNLQLVAQFVESKRNGRARLLKELKSNLMPGSSKPTSAHRLLVSMAKKIVTTNFDTLIEDAASVMKPTRGYRTITKPTDCSNLTPPFIIKNHGCITDERTLVITQNDYLEKVAYGDLLETVLKVLYCSHDLVLLGYSAKDIDFILKLYDIRQQLGKFSGKVFAVLKDLDRSTRQYLHASQITPIKMDVAKFLGKLLWRLRQQITARFDDKSITIGGFEISFGLVAGSIQRATYKKDRIAVRRENTSFTPHHSIIPLIREHWQQRKRTAKQKRQELTNGRLASLYKYTKGEKGGKLTLYLRRTTYRTFIGTNLLLSEGGPSSRSLRKSIGGNFSIPSDYLANPLNVIGMLVTSDRFTFIPQRTPQVYERPGTWQASVGGALRHPNEHPTDALIREIEEEWGLEVTKEDILFFGLGINQKTGEPDLLAIVKTKHAFAEVIQAFSGVEQPEFASFESLKLVKTNLPSFVLGLLTKEWSQPSDQAAVLLTLIHELGHKAVEDAFRSQIKWL